MNKQWRYRGKIITSSLRSGFEKKIEAQLKEAGVKYGYESETIEWRRGISKGVCGKCGSDETFQRCSYTPDFVLDNGVWIEAKGYLDGPDRTKLKAIRKQHPEIDLRLVFQRDNVIKGTKNKTRYSEWAEKIGFKWALGKVPKDWLK
jgi:IS5 family transposase